MSLSLAELIRFQTLEAEVKDLRAVIARQAVQISALIATHPTPDAVEIIINPPPAPESVPVVEVAAPTIDIPPVRERQKPGPKPRLFGENPAHA